MLMLISFSFNSIPANYNNQNNNNNKKKLVCVCVCFYTLLGASGGSSSLPCALGSCHLLFQWEKGPFGTKSNPRPYSFTQPSQPRSHRRFMLLTRGGRSHSIKAGLCHVPLLFGVCKQGAWRPLFVDVRFYRLICVSLTLRQIACSNNKKQGPNVTFETTLSLIALQ